jgi:hypothetical protein
MGMGETMKRTRELPPPPTLTPLQIATLQSVIEERLNQCEEGRGDRIKKILRYRAMHKDDYSHRVEAGSIYEVSNIGVPLLKAVATSYAAKVEDELLSSETPFQVKPREDDDKDKAEMYDHYWTFEIMDQMNFGRSASEGIAVCCVEGTAIKKRSWRIDRSYFPAIRQALHDESGQPVMGPDGEHIFDDHETIEVEPTAMEKALTLGFAKGRMHVLFGEDEVGPELTDGHSYQPVTIKDSITHYDGAESKVIPFEDFICSLNVDSIAASPIIGHKYQNRLYEVLERVSETADGSTEQEAVTAAGWIFDNLTKLKDLPDADSAEGSKNTPGANKPDTKLGETQASALGFGSNDKLHKKVNLIECYLKYDIDGDGQLEDMIVLVEAETKMPLWVVYLVSVYEDCKLPFEIHGFFQVPNRWYSMGPYEYLECAQDFVDKVFNRMNYRTSMSANPITWEKPDNFVKRPKKFGPGERCQLRGTARIEDSMGFITMPQMEGVEWQHFQFFISLIQLTTGISNAAQGDISSLPSTQTATGITSIINEGNKLYRMFIRRQQGSNEREIAGLVRLNQQNLDEEKVIRYFSKSKREEIQQMVSPDELRNLDFDVKIVLTKSGVEQKANMISKAIDILNGWIAVPPQFQPMFRDMYVQLLQTIGIVDAERILPSVESMEEDQGRDQMIQQAIEQISAAAQKIEGGEMDPKKQVAADLMNVMQALQQIISVPPDLENPEAAASAPSAGESMSEKMGTSAPIPEGQPQPLQAQ